MSALGQKRTHAPQSSLFDQVVGAPNNCVGHVYAERLGGLEVDVQFKFRALLDRQLSRLFAFENTGGVDAGETVSREGCRHSS
jgi:hypothetical protein